MKDLTLYTFASDFAYIDVITQKNEIDHEILVTFTRSAFKGEELNYSTIDKNAFTFFKAVKHFIFYLMKSKTKVIVPYLAVRNLLVQKELGEKRAHWMTTLEKYDLEIKLAQIGKGQGLCKLVVESVNILDKYIFSDNEIYLIQSEVLCLPNNPNSWYSDIKFYLLNGTIPPHLEEKKKRAVRLKPTPF